MEDRPSEGVVIFACVPVEILLFHVLSTAPDFLLVCQLAPTGIHMYNVETH